MSQARTAAQSPGLKLWVNGECRLVPEDCTVAALVELLELEGRKLAVAVNRRVVPRSGFGTRSLRAGDHVEILEAVAGG